MKPEYANLGFLRHFALVRRLVDEISALNDQIRAMQAKHATEIKYYRDENAMYQNRWAQKNQVGPIHPELAQASTVVGNGKSVERTGLDVLNRRQKDVDVQAQRERERIQAAKFREEAQEIIDANLVAK